MELLFDGEFGLSDGETSHVLCKYSNGERASLANIKLTIGSLLACSLSVKSLVDRLS